MMKNRICFTVATLAAALVEVAAVLAGSSLLVSPAMAEDQVPSLQVTLAGDRILLSWPATAAGFVLETAPALAPNAEWFRTTNAVTISGSNSVVSLSSAAGKSFYRLHKIEDPITAPQLTWTWVPFADAFCMEGDTLGIGVNLSTNSHRVLIFLNGGGACWDETTCYTLNTATHGPFGPAQFNILVPALNQAWLFDRTAASNPFKDYSYVFVPYCTGDLHAGSQVANYGSRTNLHVGYQNITAYLRRLVPTFASAERVVLAGSGSGGYGATFNWRQTQEAFGNIRVDLIDDSGPLLPPDVLPANGAFLGPVAFTNWNLGATLPNVCTTCQSNFGSLFGYYADAFPNSRAALLSFNQDQTISSLYGISQSTFTSGLNELLTAQFDPHPNLRYFVASGTSHTLLTRNPPVSVNGVTLGQFLTQMLTEDPAWTSVHP